MTNIMLSLLIGVWCLIAVILGLGSIEVYHLRLHARKSPKASERTGLGYFHKDFTSTVHNTADADRREIEALKAPPAVLPTTATPVVTSNDSHVVDESSALISTLQSPDIVVLAIYRELHQSRNLSASMLGTNTTSQLISALTSEASHG